MTIEERLRALHAKGELVHLSLIYTGGTYRCNYASALRSNGYSSGEDVDPVVAIEKALKAVVLKRASKSVTAAVTSPVEAPKDDATSRPLFNDDWTKP